MSGMFAGYNKGSNRGTLTGNWVEEDALRKRTGQSRYESWVPLKDNDVDDDDDTPHTEIIKKKPEATVERVILHDDAQDPRTYESTSKGATGEICTPSSVIPSRVGRRREEKTNMLYARAQELHIEATCAKELVNNQNQQHHQQSVSRSAYPAYDTQYIINLPRVAPRGRNGGRPTSGDEKCENLTKRQRDAQDTAVLAKMGTNTPVSIYSHGLHTGKGLNFALSSTAGDNPFAKFTAFTNDIRDERKVHGEASDPGQDFATSIGPNIHQRSAIARIQALVLENENTLARFKDVFCNREEERLTLKELESKLRAAGVETMKSLEIQQVFLLFDKSHSHEINVSDFRRHILKC